MDDESFSIHITPPHGTRVKDMSEDTPTRNRRHTNKITVATIVTLVLATITIIGWLQSNLFFSAKEGIALKLNYEGFEKAQTDINVNIKAELKDIKIELKEANKVQERINEKLIRISEKLRVGMREDDDR